MTRGEKKYKNPLPFYRSGITGKPVDLRDAGIAVVSRKDIKRGEPFGGNIESADLHKNGDLNAIKSINLFFWGSTEQDVFGRTYDVLQCDNYLARPGKNEKSADDPLIHGIAGNMAVTLEEDFYHIVVIHVWPEWQSRGVGRALIKAAVENAKKSGLNTIKLGTTNDNLPALHFYQKIGFVIDKVITEEVLDGNGNAQVGFGGIPVRDEIRLRLDL